MKKVYYLSTCSTCRRIIKEVEPDNDFIFQDIKNEPLSKEQLDDIFALAGSYQSIFNKQARKYRELGLHSQELSEDKMRELILEEYTFLKRPVFIIDNQIFIGNSRKVINELSAFMQVHKKHSLSSH
ncbi:arsenate reductase family protein [Saccharicrinis fermentans]|uniref:Transcriptional regulator Spx n=1 Tax=Saccharicrinis fermentans DSM 9555 = JCM 21142 TaxID=869213 RepID=W7YAR2_9BACT|nr:ArsC/Spx/MgsR family protein [Saccharicrinis fermentans]GAF01441.1 transcriptional regulator Spx [Saccharicrinis fermentans DSM 9555 = JCM 21142]